jgi:exopolyphosphatase / guanosine-5'-triphosphate,3'-diphosphate pyrophosphatase
MGEGGGRARSDGGRVAVIDIGSNSIRLVVYERLSRAPMPLLNEKVLCGLARGLEETGRLSPEGVRSAFIHLDRFVALARAIGVSRLDALATAAVRDAEDGPAFAQEVQRRCHARVQILSGEEEGRLSALGVISAIPGAYGVVGDLGGGSVELVPVRAGRPGRGGTLPIGPFRLQGLQGDNRRLTETIERAVATLPWLAKRRDQTFYAVGGAWRALARIHMEQAHYPIHVIHGYTLPYRDADDFLGLVARLSRRSLEQIGTVSRKRLEVVPISAEILRRVLAAMRPKRLVFSAWGLREGHLYDLLSERLREGDPLIEGCAEHASALPRFQADGARVAEWLRPVFGRTDPYRRLRHAAALLGDIASREHPDYRAEQAYRAALFSPMTGLDHRERVFLASALHARYGGPEAAIRDVVSRLIDGEMAAAARVTGLALRLAFTLSGGVSKLLKGGAISVSRGELVLRLQAQGPLQGAEAVERRLGALARALDLDPRIRLSAARG